MNFVLATLCGIIVTTMNVFNGQLSDYTGVYLSTVIIHLVGLVTFLIIMKIKNKKVCFKKQIPLYMYCGGCIGVLTVIFNVFAIGKIGASLMTALGLLGQMMTSLLLENKGWLATSIRKLNTGVTIVLSRSVNGLLSKKMGAYQGTFYNYFTGFMTSLILMLVLMIVGVQHINISLDKTNLMMYLGGIIGVFNILILNIIVPRISPVILTLLSFIGQLVSGMVIDAFVYQMFSVSKILGCLIVIIGLVIYQLSEEKA